MKIEEIIPLNGHLYIEPVEKKQILVADTGRLETFGKVIAMANDLQKFVTQDVVGGTYTTHGTDIQIGDYVAFELWDVKDISTNEKKYYLIRAEEIICKVRMSGELVT